MRRMVAEFGGRLERSAGRGVVVKNFRWIAMMAALPLFSQELTFFEGFRDWIVGANPMAVTRGDFNGDGKPDLVTANADDGTISVLLNNGNKTFQRKRDFATGGHGDDALLGGDGRLQRRREAGCGGGESWDRLRGDPVGTGRRDFSDGAEYGGCGGRPALGGRGGRFQRRRETGCGGGGNHKRRRGRFDSVGQRRRHAAGAAGVGDGAGYGYGCHGRFQ